MAEAGRLGRAGWCRGKDVETGRLGGASWCRGEAETWQPRDKYSSQLRTKVINPVEKPHNTSWTTPTREITNTYTQRKQEVVNPLAVNCKDQIS